MADKERILANNSELLKVLTMIENVSDAEPLIFNDFLGNIDYGSYPFDFISNGVKYDGIQIVMLGPPVKTMRYCKLSEDGELVPEPGIIYAYDGADTYGADLYWLDDVYKTIYVLKKPDSLSFSYWLASNVHLDGGVDTSHGTALPEHICSGFKAVVKGQLLDGTLAVAYGGITSQVEPYDVDYMNSIGMEKTYDEPTAIYPRHGSTVMLFAPYSAFGDATPADVAKGKTFTSAAGFLSEGEAEIGGGGDDVARSIVNKTITAYSDNEITTVGAYAFNGCNKMTSVNLQNATYVDQHAFDGCSALTDVNLPNAKTVGGSAFQSCTSLTKLDLPKATVLNNYLVSGCSSLTELNMPNAESGKGFAIAGSKIEHLNLPEFTSPGSSVFRAATSLRTVDMPKLNKLEQFLFMGDTALETVTFPKVASVAGQAMESCSALTYVDLPICKRIDAKGFNKCSSLETLILRKSDGICTLANVSAFTSTPIESGTGYVYVPSALVDSYKTATNWSTCASQIRAIEDYPHIAD